MKKNYSLLVSCLMLASMQNLYPSAGAGAGEGVGRQLSEQDQQILDDQLLDAVKNNDFNAVVQVVESGANVNCLRFSRYGMGAYLMINPLIQALLNNNRDILAFLLQRGANMNVERKGDNRFLKIVVNGNNDIFQYLMELDPQAMIHLKQGKYTILIWASSRGLADKVKLLLDAGADVHAVHEGGQTALINLLSSISGYHTPASKVDVLQTIHFLIEAQDDIEDKAGLETRITNAIDNHELEDLEPIIEELQALQAIYEETSQMGIGLK